ncbi:MAG: M48 family metallopeptidase [Planctomycetes bacterium]|nr:M48 family metallopeptidase [Planctomycetota bacterium]
MMTLSKKGNPMASDADAPPTQLETASPEVKQYQRQKITIILVSTVLSLAWMALLGFVFGPALGSEYTAWFGREEWLRLLASAAFLGLTLECLTAPLDFYSGFILEHRYELSNQTLAGWWWKRIKGYAVGGTLGLALVAGLYYVLWLTGEWWWLAATAGWLIVTLVLGQLLPVVILPIFYKVTRLEDAALLERLQRLTEGTSLTIEGVYQLHLSDETKKANAALAGLGNTRRVLLGDTLLAQFTPEEIEVVFAHEIGHHVYRHLPKMIAINVFVSLVGFWLVHQVLTACADSLGYHGITDPAALPLFLFIVAIFGLSLSPLLNALSRFHERQCDQYALDRTHNPEAYRSAFIKLARINKSDPDPHPLVALLFYDHPPIRERLAMADEPAAA